MKIFLLTDDDRRVEVPFALQPDGSLTCYPEEAMTCIGIVTENTILFDEEQTFAPGTELSMETE